MNDKNLWTAVEGRLRSLLNIREFNTWFGQASLRINNETATLLLPNHLFLNWVKEKYLPLLEQALTFAAGQPMVLRFAVASPLKTDLAGEQSLGETSYPQTPKNNFFSPFIKEGYTFDNFLLSFSNELAQSACMAVAGQLGKQYNPLFIHGGAGLGKTHLLCAIGNAVTQNKPEHKICYCSAESFGDELTKAALGNEIALFQEKYRQIDCLLFDDIQFLGEDKRVQEEFFNTFNFLHSNGKQIVVTCNKAPEKINHIEKRIRILFEWGLVADLHPPDENLKIAILHSKATEHGIKLNPEVAKFIAARSDSNIRVLEGYLNKIIAFNKIQDREISLEDALKIFGTLLAHNKIKIDCIINLTASYFAIMSDDIKSNKKNRGVSYPRQVAMYLSRRLTKNSFSEIGKIFGGKDHSTVVKSVKKIESLINSNYEAEKQIRALQQSIIEEIFAGII